MGQCEPVPTDTLDATAADRASGEAADCASWERITGHAIHTLAKEVMGLNEQLAEIDKLIATRFREHDLVEVIENIPGIGPLMGCEFLAAAAGVRSTYRVPRRHSRSSVSLGSAALRCLGGSNGSISTRNSFSTTHGGFPTTHEQRRPGSTSTHPEDCVARQRVEPSARETQSLPLWGCVEMTSARSATVGAK